MKLKDFHFELPADLIARFPSEKREESRLMMVERQTGRISHHRFKDIEALTSAQDFFVANNSQVIPARLFGTLDKKKASKKREVLVVKKIGEKEVEALTQPSRKFEMGQKIYFAPDQWAEVIEIGERGKRTLRFNKPYESVLDKGYAPLPPYIKRKYDEALKYREYDLQRYQTVYSREPGSIAAPTAGLHFTAGIVQALKQRNEFIEITLSVGETTFQKIQVEDIVDHQMGRENITISNSDRKRIGLSKQSGQLTAVGTTTVRSLETYALQQPEAETFHSELFIRPGFEFKMVDKLVTNLHLPESSLYILVCAFAGLELMQEAYREAVKERYRFFSYGDAMLIV